MKSLLIAIQNTLKSGLDYVRSGDVFIAPHEDFLPESIKFPAVGLKDGAVTRREEPGGMIEESLSVTVTVWAQLRRAAETSIVGDSANKGVLEVAADVTALLDENLLGLDGVIEAFSPSESASAFFMEESGGLQNKKITCHYTRETARPSAR